jgi:two-component system, OmpR family, sensor histidine kinase MprB
MSFRQRITLSSATAVAIAIVLASALVYMLTSEQLHNQVDKQLANRALYLRYVPRSSGGGTREALLNLLKGESQTGKTGGTSAPLRGLGPRPNQVRGYQQLIDANGDILFTSSPNVTLPVDTRTVELAEGHGQSFYRDARVAGIHLRILTEQIAAGHAIQVAQPLTETDTLLSRLRLILALLDVGGIALAAGLGRLVAGAAMQPLKRLTQAAEHVAATRDLSRRIGSTGEDEIGRLASSFNAMLDALGSSMSALDASVDAQRQLVADASHELRTPVTSLRTNIELLQQQSEAIDPPTRNALLGEAVEQIEELTNLINDLIDLARGEEPATDAEDVRLDLLVSEVVERKRRSAADAGTPVELQLEPTIIIGVPARIERAVGNLVDNAIKYGPPGAPVEISLRGGELTVRDHGPGISDADLPHVFDRFYRGVEARGLPGSGLGLAIVRQLAAQQGGSIAAERATGGGTLMRLRLPGAEPAPAPAAEDELAATSARQPA